MKTMKMKKKKRKKKERKIFSNSREERVCLWAGTPVRIYLQGKVLAKKKPNASDAVTTFNLQIRKLHKLW